MNCLVKIFDFFDIIISLVEFKMSKSLFIDLSCKCKAFAPNFLSMFFTAIEKEIAKKPKVNMKKIVFFD